MAALCWDFLLHIPWTCLPYQLLIKKERKKKRRKKKISLSVGVSSLKKKIINKKVLNSLTHLMQASFCMEFFLKKENHEN